MGIGDMTQAMKLKTDASNLRLRPLNIGEVTHAGMARTVEHGHSATQHPSCMRRVKAQIEKPQAFA